MGVIRDVSVAGLVWLAACGIDVKPLEAETVAEPLSAPIPYVLPEDGLAEVARYEIARLQYGLPLAGTATMITVREDIDRDTYVKTHKPERAIRGIKLMLMATLPGMNWDYHTNNALYTAADLVPLRLSITAEEWCGNNYLEWQAAGDSVTLLGRPYGDDIGPTNETVRLPAGYYLYEQLPVLVRALAKPGPPLVVQLVMPQTAYLPPHVEQRVATLAHTGEERVETPAGAFTAAVVEVSIEGLSERFPSPERYWVDPHTEVVVKMERNETSTEFGQLHPNRMTYTLQRVDRVAYWDHALPPPTAALSDRQRATHSAQLALNLPKVFAERRGETFEPAGFITGREGDVPSEYLSRPSGDNRFSPSFDGSGGWWFDPSAQTDGRPGAFRPNVGASAQDSAEPATEVRCIGPKLVTQLGQQEQLMQAARVIPHKVGDTLAGYRLMGIRQGSIADMVGLKNGDIVNRVDGVALDSAQVVLDLYERWRGAHSQAIALDITRAGKPLALTLEIEGCEPKVDLP